MADLLTLRERFGPEWRQRTILLSWAYSPKQKSPGVAHSLLAAAGLLGLKLRLACPEEYRPDPEYITFATTAAARTGGKIEFSNNLNEAAAGVDVIYGKSWKGIMLPSDEDDRLRNAIRGEWCINTGHFRVARSGAVYMDCMPFVRGDSVTAEVADGPQSIIYDQAANRLHMQKAIMASII
jgi:ornithine carbamoyltransferase